MHPRLTGLGPQWLHRQRDGTLEHILGADQRAERHAKGINEIRYHTPVIFEEDGLRHVWLMRVSFRQRTVLRPIRPRSQYRRAGWLKCLGILKDAARPRTCRGRAIAFLRQRRDIARPTRLRAAADSR